MTTPKAAVDVMVADRFEADNFPWIVGVTEHEMIGVLVESVAQVGALFST